MIRRLRRVLVMTTRTWLRVQPDRRQGVDRRQCPDRRTDLRLGELTSCRRSRERRYTRRQLSSSQ